MQVEQNKASAGETAEALLTRFNVDLYHQPRLKRVSGTPPGRCCQHRPFAFYDSQDYIILGFLPLFNSGNRFIASMHHSSALNACLNTPLPKGA